MNPEDYVWKSVQRYAADDSDMTEEYLNHFAAEGYEVFRMDDETITFRKPKTESYTKIGYKKPIKIDIKEKIADKYD